MTTANTAQWRSRALAATRGTRLGAILSCALNPLRDSAPDCPRFVGRAVVTSDGYLMCSFVDKDGYGHNHALAGSMVDLDANISGLARHLQLNDEDRISLECAIRLWIVADYRSATQGTKA